MPYACFYSIDFTHSFHIPSPIQPHQGDDFWNKNHGCDQGIPLNPTLLCYKIQEIVTVLVSYSHLDKTTVSSYIGINHHEKDPVGVSSPMGAFSFLLTLDFFNKTLYINSITIRGYPKGFVPRQCLFCVIYDISAFPAFHSRS